VISKATIRGLGIFKVFVLQAYLGSVISGGPKMVNALIVSPSEYKTYKVNKKEERLEEVQRCNLLWG
jgi:hypothetical protein